MEEKLQFSSPSTVPMQRKCESILFFSLVVYVFFFFEEIIYTIILYCLLPCTYNVAGLLFI